MEAAEGIGLLVGLLVEGVERAEALLELGDGLGALAQGHGQQAGLLGLVGEDGVGLPEVGWKVLGA